MAIDFDKEKCVKCKACAKDCITYSIDFDEEGYPKIAENGEPDRECRSPDGRPASTPLHLPARSVSNRRPEAAEKHGGLPYLPAAPAIRGRHG